MKYKVKHGVIASGKELKTGVTIDAKDLSKSDIQILTGLGTLEACGEEMSEKTEQPKKK